MKKKFEGEIHKGIPNGIGINKWLDSGSLLALAKASDTPFSVVTHQEYTCVEYRMKMNLFTFGKYKCGVQMTVIAPPISVDSTAYTGDVNRLIADYKHRKGIFLILNLPALPLLTEKAAVGETLSSCVFHKRFSSFEEYLLALRGSYRRRLKKALEKGGALRVEQIRNADFTDELHGLYRQVRQRSNYPLETLRPDFFRGFDGNIFVFYDGASPVAFAAVKQFDEELDFVFGGMNYAARDELDLYYNMLLFILRRGIECGARRIDFGQTAEHSKQRIGCVLEKRYMAAFSGNRLINGLLRLFGNALTYQAPKEAYQCFKK
ncbi:MAG: GNAT family N-acetyltransferase [Clostridiales Family XIII bacterium]|jgi:hypothetical protein|nr:GNAT family N-acetyltransferase [Clostridiales Family XIII bacterium]